ncbi:hypothetical protein HPB52_003655 [Rhipicephalus sanguineus]|uniref:Organic cation/carnitine transporter n=1 Tax=Rhipicephalus sanguineus TaxID=34632 RepID=A0A9D4Q8M8_RHISA|nr:hypothetical protein HPB52_003655 [Rhipicephalus sanguineus]
MNLFFLQKFGGIDSETSDCFDTKEAFGSGLFQRRFLTLTAVAIFLTTCIGDLVPVISSQDVDHWCKRPTRSTAFSVHSWKKDAIPVDADGRRSRCIAYKRPGNLLPFLRKDGRATVACRQWDFDDKKNASIVSVWNAVCDRRVPQLVVPMATQQAGSLLFLLLSGVALDFFGRGCVQMAAVVVSTTSALVGCAVSHNHAHYAVAQFVLSGCVAVSAAAAMLVSFEVLVHRQRSKHVVYVAALSFALAELWILVVKNMHVGWVVKQVALLSPMYLLVVATTLMGGMESPRWLIAQGENHKAEEVIRAAGNTNDFVLAAGAENFIHRIEYRARCIADGNLSSTSNCDLRQRSAVEAARSIRQRVRITFVVHFSLAFAVHVNAVTWVARDERVVVAWWLPSILVYVVTALGSVAGLLAYACIPLRKVPLAASAVVAGIYYVAVVFSDLDTAVDRGLIAFSGGLANVAIIVGACRVMEDVPTSVRGVALCWTLAGGRAGALLACMTPLFLGNGKLAFVLSAFLLTTSSILAALRFPSHTSGRCRA